jgi:hypothetical protein
MANSIQTTGLTQGTISTAHNSGESVSNWVSRHTDSVDKGTPGNQLTTSWPCAEGNESVTSTRQLGESDKDFIARHEAEYMLAMLDCPPVP